MSDDNGILYKLIQEVSDLKNRVTELETKFTRDKAIKNHDNYSRFLTFIENNLEVTHVSSDWVLTEDLKDPEGIVSFTSESGVRNNYAVSLFREVLHKSFNWTLYNHNGNREPITPENRKRRACTYGIKWKTDKK